MVEPLQLPPPLPRPQPDDDLSADTSRLDGSLLRYVLLHRSRLNMLRLDRQIRALVDGQGVVALPPGASRSDMAMRAEATMQLAVEIALARPAVARWIGRDALRRQRATDAAYYPSECWLAGEEPDLASGEPFPWIGHPAGGPALPHNAEDILATPFWRYLVERSRLQEEHVRAADESDPSPRSAEIDTSHLLADSQRLQAIAADVLLLLGDTMDREAWRVCVEEAGRDGRLRQPPPEVFDALLTGPDALVRAVLPNQRIGWALTPDGEPTWPEPWQNDGGPEPLGAIRSRIDGWHASLGRLLVVDDNVQPLVLLSDRLGLIPTTPAWPDVDSALRSLAAAQSQQEHDRVRGQSSPVAAPDDALQTESRLVRLFGALLASQERQIADALLIGAFLGALRESEEPGLSHSAGATSRRLGLELLAEGLRFRETDGEGIARKMAGLRAELAAEAVDGRRAKLRLDAPVPETVPLPIVDHLPQLVQRSELAASSWRGSALWNVPASAWDATRTRLVRFCRDGRVGDASLPELVCAARHEGPARWVTLDPRRMTLAAWSRAWMASIVHAEVPAWLGVIALQRLGVNTLRVTEQERLLRALMQVEAVKSPAAGTALPRPNGSTGLVELSARGEGAWRRGGLGGGAAILLRAEPSAITSTWQRAGSRGLLLLLTVAELRRLVDGHSDHLRSLPRPCTLWREDGALDTRWYLRLAAQLRDIQSNVPGWRRLLRQWALLASPATGEPGVAAAGLAGPDELFGSAVTEEVAG